jgi:hypothetical protein
MSDVNVISTLEFGAPGSIPPRPILRPIERIVGAVTYIDIPAPPMGGKCWLLESKGLFVLEPGPGTLRTIACTHGGSGAIEVLDGIPDDNGFFADEAMLEPIGPLPSHYAAPRDYDDAVAQYNSDLKAYHCRRGRPLYRANPVVMGSWMLDGGFHHGLTIRAQGGSTSACAIASIVWMPFRQRTKPDLRPSIEAPK